MGKAKSTEKAVSTIEAVKFSKQNILKLQKYIGRMDILNALLCDGEEYTIAQVDVLYDKFMKGKVK